jgi:uncharacterized damage-inducible protein DinB
MSEITRILDQYQRAYSGASWSGDSLMRTLAGLSAEQAAARPLPQAHSIWEIVLHLRSWQDMVRRRLEAERYLDMPETENWPAIPEVSGKAWMRDIVALSESRQLLVAAVTALTDARLDDSFPGQEPAAGESVYVLLHGLVQHTVYHTGQLVLLRKLV